jgi:hypothetical protein
MEVNLGTMKARKISGETPKELLDPEGAFCSTEIVLQPSNTFPILSLSLKVKV